MSARLDRLVAARIAHSGVLEARERALLLRVEREAFRAVMRRTGAPVRGWADVVPLVVTVGIDVTEATSTLQLRAREIGSLRLRPLGGTSTGNSAA